jgi:hypothetical protein
MPRFARNVIEASWFPVSLNEFGRVTRRYGSGQGARWSIALIVRQAGRRAVLAALHPYRLCNSDRPGRRRLVWRARGVVPQLRRSALIVNVGASEAVLEIGEVQAAARPLGIEVTPLKIQRAEDIVPAFEVLKGQADALYAVVDALIAVSEEQCTRRGISR